MTNTIDFDTRLDLRIEDTIVGLHEAEAISYRDGVQTTLGIVTARMEEIADETSKLDIGQRAAILWFATELTERVNLDAARVERAVNAITGEPANPFAALMEALEEAVAGTDLEQFLADVGTPETAGA